MPQQTFDQLYSAVEFADLNLTQIAELSGILTVRKTELLRTTPTPPPSRCLNCGKLEQNCTCEKTFECAFCGAQRTRYQCTCFPLA
jgi:hypothetical protein